MFEAISFALTFGGLAIASYTDLKERIVPDFVPYSMIIIGVLLSAASWQFSGDNSLLIASICVAIGTFLVSLALWKAGFWAGGDVKLFTGIAALNPYNTAVLAGLFGLNAEIFQPTSLPVFPFTLFLYSIFCLAPFGLLVAAKKILKDKEILEKEKAGAFTGIKKTFFFSLAAAGTTSIAAFFSLHFAFGLAFLFVLGFFAGKFFWQAAIVSFIFGLVLRQEAIFEFFAIFLAGLLVVFLLRLFSISKSGALSTKVPVEKLEEGMIPAQTFFEQNGQIMEWKPSIKSILNNLKDNNVDAVKGIFAPKGRVICASSAADGLEKIQIQEIMELARKGFIPKEIRIKESTAFVPAIFIAYIVLSLTGDVLWNIIL